MRNIRLFLGVGLVLLLALSTLPAFGAEGKTPVWQPIVIGPGMEGHYIVTRDILGLPGMPVIDVLPGTVAVQIDLNGFTLYGSDTDAIRVNATDSVTITNGTIMGGAGSGVNAIDCRKVVIEDVKIQFTQRFGIELVNVANFTVKRNIMVSDSAAANFMLGGVWVDGTLAADPVEGVIEDNQVSNVASGITVQNGSSVSIRDNRVENAFAGDGIRVWVCNGCMIAENTIQESQGMGILLEEVNVCKIYNNVVFGCVEGIALFGQTSDCILLDNNSSRNMANGLMVDGMRNHIDRNVFNFNGLAGIWFTQMSQDNTFGRNTVRANQMSPSGCVATTPPCFAPDICDDVGSNTSFGDNMGPGPGC
ncbi:MAG: hypothetical protein DRJ50_15035 [Actinobacteria bacterium]|nr:MAG: hypothetical protein DRJ50_15035 [Actinomycetota bacterium]